MPVPVLKRWWIYQRERFPLMLHAPLVAAFSFSAVCCSKLLRADVTLPSAMTLGVAFLSALLFFLQLRIADEFKDAEDDARYRPYLPVPRGLIQFSELRRMLVGTVVVQAVLAFLLSVRLFTPLVGVWTILGLMSVEFFVPHWIRPRPGVYMILHMLIVPAIDFYTSACDWACDLRTGSIKPPSGLNWFLLVSYLNGIVIELGRKIRPPEMEETGVDTYSSAWGYRTATWLWIGALILNGLASVQAAHFIAFEQFVLWLVVCLGAIGVVIGLRFAAGPSRKGSRLIAALSGVWTLMLYLSLGVIPLVYRCWR